MSKCPEHIVHSMNNYLDGDISPTEEAELKKYLNDCIDCRKHYHELNKTIAFIQSASYIKPPADFIQKTMASLPKQKPRANVQRWFRNHPFLTAAALFMVLMSTMMFTSYNDDQQFSFTKQPSLVVEGETVIVPEGETVIGDLTIRNGDLRVEGELHGNVTIVNGQYMASSGVIVGEIEEIDQVFEWLWFTIKNGFKDVLSMFSRDET